MTIEVAVGSRFTRLTVLQRLVGGSGGPYWQCQCDCGTVKRVAERFLRSGRTKSCGCLKTSQIAEVRKTHDMSKTRTYKSWLDMRERCNDVTNPDYGGRGITYAAHWEDFELFVRDMGEAPDGMTIERIDVNGNYEPENCRWATLVEQANNKRNNLLLTLNGETLTAAQWAARLNLTYKTILTRKGRLGWSDERTLTTPSRQLTRRTAQ